FRRQRDGARLATAFQGFVMTDRERRVSGRKPAAATAVLEPLRPAVDLAEPSAAVAWEVFFRHASAAQQQEVLTLARRQGFVYTHQLPSPNGNGAVQTDTVR